MTVADQLAGRDVGSPAVRAGSRSWTVGDLLAAVRRSAAELSGGRGPVAIGLPDPLGQLVWALAADLTGRTAAVLDPRWPAPQRAAALATIGPSTVVRPGGPVPGTGGGPEGRGWIAFTSGTTGAPGALWRDPATWSDSFPAFTEVVGLRVGWRVLVPGPLSSSLCAFAALHALAAGGCAVLLPRWDARPVPKVEVEHLVPAMLRDRLDDADAAPPRVAVVGGASLDPALELRTHRCWPATRIVHYYGSSEQSFLSVRVGGEAGTVGHAFPGVALSVRDDSFVPLPPGRAGVLWTRSPYAARPLTAGRLREREGWVSVGDRGWLDEAGGLRLLGRERILTGGSTVEPGAVEAVLRELPGVREAVVVGLPHPRLGELVAAVLDADPAAVRAVRSHVRGRLSPAQRPRRWYVVSPMPRTALGKPARGQLAAAARAGRLPRLS